MLAAGKLRHIVTIQYPVIEQDSNGGTIVDQWAQFGKYWAAIEPLSGKELIAAQAAQSKVTGRITIRYVAGIYPGMRIVHGPRIYNIEAILRDRDSGLEYITFPVSEGVRYDEAS